MKRSRIPRPVRDPELQVRHGDPSTKPPGVRKPTGSTPSTSRMALLVWRSSSRMHVSAERPLRPPRRSRVGHLESRNVLCPHIHMRISMVAEGVAGLHARLQVIEIGVFQRAADQKVVQLHSVLRGNRIQLLNVQLAVRIDGALAVVPHRRPIREVGTHLHVEGEAQTELRAVGIHGCPPLILFANTHDS